VSVEHQQEPSQAGCEVLFELFRGPHGAVHLGRMLKGIDSGRFVTLREASELDAPKLLAIDLARSLAHPRLLKLLGVVRSANGQHLASEYVPGTTLLELEASVRAAHFPLRPAVAVRIVKEALRAAEATQELLRDTAGHAYARCLFADTVWIAEFGDVMLTDVVVAALLGKHPESDPSVAATKDLFAIAIQLFQLVTGKVISPGLSGKLAAYVPLPLAEVLERALGFGDSTPYATLGELRQALEELPDEFHVDEREVCEELKRRIGAQLTQRRNKLGLLQAAGSHQDEDDMTRVFRVPAGSLPPRSPNPDTLRPPANGAAEGFPPSDPNGSSQSWQDMPTRIGQIPEAVSELARPSDRPTAEPPLAAGADQALPPVAPPPSAAAPVSTPPSVSAPSSMPGLALASSVRGPLSIPPSGAPARKLPSPWFVVALLAALGGAWWAASTSHLLPSRTFIFSR
jgi:hypothetical protein